MTAILNKMPETLIQEEVESFSNSQHLLTKQSSLQSTPLLESTGDIINYSMRKKTQANRANSQYLTQ